MTINALRVDIHNNQSTAPVLFHFETADDLGSMALVRESADWKIGRVETAAFSAI